MQHGDDNTITGLGAAIVSDVLAEVGGPLPIPAAQLAALLGLYLWPHNGTCDHCNAPAAACERFACCPDCTHGPDGLCDSMTDKLEGWAGRIRYTCTLPPAAQERAIAFGCGKWLVAREVDGPLDASLIEYVASALCGLPRLPLSVRPLSSAPPESASSR